MLKFTDHRVRTGIYYFLDIPLFDIQKLTVIKTSIIRTTGDFNSRSEGGRESVQAPTSE